MRRRVGQRLRTKARDRRLEVLREKWPALLLIVLSAFALATGTALVFKALCGHFAAGVAFGFYLGGVAALIYVAFRELDDEGRRLWTGLEGEEQTAKQLRKLRRQGWRAVHNIQFDGFDVDHVAVGPGGFVVVDSKAGDAPWTWYEQRDIPTKWARQAQRNGRNIRSLIKQLTGVDAPTTNLVATWIKGEPDESRSIDGVTILPGDQLVATITQLPPRLDKSTAKSIAVALSAKAQAWGQLHGIKHDRWLRRIVG
jgi:hypothetical protein